jgi:hypothetical protein
VRQYIKYLGYLLRHKWYVTVECLKHGLVWRGLTHDLDKFLPSMFVAYADQFYDPDGSKRSKTRNADGSYDPTSTGNLPFELAFFHHTRRCDHHWQYWVQATDLGEELVRPMLKGAVKEMVCDWIGAGRAQGTPDTLFWWQANSRKMRFAKETWDLVVLTLYNYTDVKR